MGFKMPKFNVQMARLESRIYCFEIDANNQEQAENLAYERLFEANAEDGEIVHADQWVHETSRGSK